MLILKTSIFLDLFIVVFFFEDNKSTFMFRLTKAFAKDKLDKLVPSIQTFILILILTTKIR